MVYLQVPVEPPAWALTAGSAALPADMIKRERNSLSLYKCYTLDYPRTATLFIRFQYWTVASVGHLHETTLPWTSFSISCRQENNRARRQSGFPTFISCQRQDANVLPKRRQSHQGDKLCDVSTVPLVARWPVFLARGSDADGEPHTPWIPYVSYTFEPDGSEQQWASPVCVSGVCGLGAMPRARFCRTFKTLSLTLATSANTCMAHRPSALLHTEAIQ